MAAVFRLGFFCVSIKKYVELQKDTTTDFGLTERKDENDVAEKGVSVGESGSDMKQSSIA